MKMIAFILPGFKHSPYRKIYKEVMKLFRARNIDTFPVNVDWKYKTISQNVQEFLRVYDKVNVDKKYVFGFSYGAVISFLASTKVKPTAQILCSLSPYFKEDLPSIFKSWKKGIGKRRLENFSKLTASKLCSQIKAETFLLYGKKEGRFIQNRAKDTKKD